jgi:hypothetical protein
MATAISVAYWMPQPESVFGGLASVALSAARQ